MQGAEQIATSLMPLFRLLACYVILVYGLRHLAAMCEGSEGPATPRCSTLKARLVWARCELLWLGFDSS